ncbi:retrovirus-related Pol polyprotein from transposon TNT 1-94 [Trichonephila clavipes]|nr:retrovirus-related Pol polyprotein from transposon TNT 1-94 [Trichonephila clavipes]
MVLHFLRTAVYVPKINRNLFSALASQDINQNSEFVSTECWLKVNCDVVLYGSRIVNGSLFKANIEQILLKEMTEVHTVVADSSLLQLYPVRWSHKDKRHIRNVLEKELDIRKNQDEKLCERCFYGKVHKLSFGTRKKASEPGELISADVCGPFDESFQKKSGGEFDNKDIRKIFHSNGITQELTAPYTPEQKGASEREMQTTSEMARTFNY